MGYCLMAYAVKLHNLRQMAGSKDKGFLKAIVPRVEEDEDDAKTAAECHSQLVMGNEESAFYESSCAHKYYYVLEAWCEAFGQPLPNGKYCAMRFGWFDTIQQRAKEAGLDARVVLPADLIYRYDILPALNLPTPDDFPCVGSLELGKMEDIKVALDENMDKVKDSDVREALKQYHGWLEVCIRTEMDLVVYYY